MSQRQVQSIKPFLSIVFFMLFLFCIALIKMENRRLGNSFVKLAHKEKELRIQQREKAIQLAKMTGPHRLQFLATERLPLQKAKRGQIIQMSGEGVALVQ